jgi:hypothetical protein
MIIFFNFFHFMLNTRIKPRITELSFVSKRITKLLWILKQVQDDNASAHM